MRGGDEEGVGCTKASAKENDRFKVCGTNADWPEKGREKMTGLDQGCHKQLDSAGKWK